MKFRTWISFVGTACVGGLVIVSAAEMNAQQSGQGKQLSATEVRTFLRIPNGLEQAANLTGNFVSESEPYVLVNPSLDGFVRSSSLVVVASLVGSESRLSKLGNDIYTDYHFTPQAFIKGTVPGSSEIIVTTKGGKVQFSNGTTAEIKTIEWTHLSKGYNYLLCLMQQGDHYFFTGGYAGVFQLRGALDPEVKLVPLASFSQHPHRVLEDVRQHTPQSLLRAVRQLVAAQQADSTQK